MIIGASSFAGDFPELIKEVSSIELYIPKLGVYEGTKLDLGKIRKIKEFISSYDIQTSIHAPYFGDGPNYPPELMVDTASLGDTQYRLLNDSIMMAEKLGSSVVVIHPGRIDSNRKSSFDGMVSGLSRLAKVAEDTDPNNLCCQASELIEAIDRIGSPNLRATLDIGHANLTCKGNAGRLRDFTRILKNYVVHVHVHDNEGHFTEKYWGDLHGAPGSGCIDFSVLQELDFDVVLNLEVKKILSRLFDRNL
jgi:sugar phosphate isomerase/epimerase